MKLTVNGAEHDVLSPPLTTLLQVLREELYVTSPKAGCQQGGCGACTVLVDGEPRRSCLLPVISLDAAQVTTVEGLGAPGDLSPVQAAFHEHYAAQCGYCTGGMLMAAQGLLQRNGGPVERDQVTEALGAHICRCTGYVKIVEAVMAAWRGEVDVAKLDELAEPEPGQPALEIPGSPA